MAAAATLTGCASAGHEPPPAPPMSFTMPEAWQSGARAGQLDADLLGFHSDPELQALIAEALAHNADLQIAGARLEQAHAAMKAAGGALLPQVGLVGQSGAATLPGSNLSTTGLAAVASWEIDLWGRLRAERDASQARFYAAELDARYAREALAAGVVRAWLGVAEAAQQLALARDMLALSERQLQLTQTGRAVGRDSAQDVARSEAAAQAYRQQIEVDQQVLAQRQRALAILLGRYPSPEAAPGLLPELTALPAAGIPSEVLTRRPDVVAAERRFQAAFADVEAAKRARLPSLQLIGGVAYVADSVVTLESAIANPVWALSGKLLAPIFTGGRIDAQIEAKTGAQQEAMAQYAKASLTALGEVEEALASERALANRADIAAKQVDLLGQAVGYAQVEATVGKGDQRRVVSQQLSLAAAQAELLHLKAERLANRVALHQALGGRFSASP
ncbi:efflux transporter outer membrane subunit [Phenylobacterium sp.]|uniref:efflux transporter outer membrane subunit n=1 Tax=Phenylobacterium sp. TaxID=1871053 RepID=UPI0025E3ECF3|nr:efflux transporter outer membrane subunit [Phenylobacterium sp.]